MYFDTNSLLIVLGHYVCFQTKKKKEKQIVDKIIKIIKIMKNNKTINKKEN